MSKDRDHHKRTILLFILVSVLLHFLIGFVFFLVPKQTPKIAFREPEQKVIWVKPEAPPPQEIADIERPLQEKRPEKAKFAGQYDSTVKEETVARFKPKPKVIKEDPLSSERPPRPRVQKRPRPVVKPSPEIPPIAPDEQRPPPKEVAEKKEEKKERPEKEPVQVTEKSDLEKPEKKEEIPEKKPVDLGLKPQDVLPKQQTTPPTQIGQRKSLDFKVSPGLEQGRPSAPDLFQHDHFPDYKYGGKTYLNVMKLQDVGYFVKMKRILKMRWNPIPSVRDYVYANRISAGRIQCVLGVALDETGRIAEMVVIRSSGLGAYDQEALQTFRDSSPFSAPPAEFVKDGRVRMSWTFTVYL